MKKLILALLLLNSSIQADTVADFLEKHNIDCKEYHVETIKHGNLTVYDITCSNDAGVYIYQATLEQVVQTHYIGK